MAQPAAQQVVDVNDFAIRVGCDERSLSGLMELLPGDQLVAMDMVEKQECKNSSAVLWSAVRQIKQNAIHMRLEYLQRNLDERCQEALKRLSPMLQDSLCQQIDLSKARNLSAFVFGMIRQAQTDPDKFMAAAYSQHIGNGSAVARRLEPVQPMQPIIVGYDQSFGVPLAYGRDRSRSPMGAMGPPVVATPAAIQGTGQIVSNFRMRFPIDDKATDGLLSLSAEDQFIACGLVEKRAPRNPSAVTWSVVKLLQSSPIQARMEYVKHVVDQNACLALDNLAPGEAELIFSQMDLSNVRNVSAFVWSRIKEISKSPAKPVQVERVDMALQARAPPQTAPQNKPKARIPPAPPAPPATLENNENDLESVASMGLVLDKRCQAKLAELSHADQLEILSSVDHNVRNPSAYVWSKIKGR